VRCGCKTWHNYFRTAPAALTQINTLIVLPGSLRQVVEEDQMQGSHDQFILQRGVETRDP